jgi:hypothetical protein
VVLEAFDARPSGGRWGDKDGAKVLVGPASEPMTEGAIEAACRRIDVDKLVVLAWEWTGHDSRMLRKRVLEEHGVELTMFTIPVELLRGSVSKKRLRFLERPEVELEMVPDGASTRLAVRITDVRCPEPSRWREDKSNKGNKHERTELSWPDYIDNWRVDFRGTGPFSPTWQAVRQREELTLQSPSHSFEEETRVAVKVFTVFGDEVERTIRIVC